MRLCFSALCLVISSGTHRTARAFLDMVRLRAIVFCLSGLALGCSVFSLEGSASTSMYQARVKQAGDVPCFALQKGPHTARHASRLVRVHVAIPQSAAMARDGSIAWSIGFPQGVDRTLQGEECIKYGDSPPGTESMVAAEELQLGVGYLVTLNTDLVNTGRLENRRYAGHFCLSSQTDGSIKVHDLGATPRSDVLADDACRGLYRVK